MAITLYPLFISRPVTAWTTRSTVGPLPISPPWLPKHLRLPWCHGSNAPCDAGRCTALQSGNSAIPAGENEASQMLVVCFIIFIAFGSQCSEVCTYLYCDHFDFSLLLIFPLLAWWPGAGSAQPFPGCHESPVQHSRSPESGELAAGEEPVATHPDPCPHTLPHSGPAESQLSPRVSYGCFFIIFSTCYYDAT